MPSGTNFDSLNFSYDAGVCGQLVFDTSSASSSIAYHNIFLMAQGSVIVDNIQCFFVPKTNSSTRHDTSALNGLQIARHRPHPPNHTVIPDSFHDILFLKTRSIS